MPHLQELINMVTVPTEGVRKEKKLKTDEQVEEVNGKDEDHNNSNKQFANCW